MAANSNLTNNIEEYRVRFRIAPLGQWATAQGTFDAVSNDLFTFHPDHTGVIRYGSVFSGEAEVGFEWREKSERAIEVRYTDEDETDTTEPWDEIAYDFKTKESDTGGEVVMYENGQDGFWDSPAPLRLVKETH